MQYQARMAAEVRQFFADCSSALYGADLCLKGQETFTENYYDAYEGNVQDQLDVGIAFMRGSPFGVQPDPAMACGWWIVTGESGGPLPINPALRLFATICQEVSGAATAASAIDAEMQRVENLTY